VDIAQRAVVTGGIHSNQTKRNSPDKIQAFHPADGIYGTKDVSTESQPTDAS
jgi:hypothetical protein